MINDNNSSKALKSGFWYTLSNFIVKAIGLITTLILARLLTHAEFGIYNNYTSWLSILTILITMQLESTLISARFDFEKTIDEYILSILVMSAVFSAFGLIVINVFMIPISAFTDLKPVYLNIMLIYLMFLPGINFYQIRERYSFQYKNTVISSLVLAVSTAGLSVLLVVLMSDKISGRIYGASIPTIVIGIVFYFYFILKGRHVRFKYWKYALPIALPFIPHLLSMTVLNSTDRIMINKICGPEDAALYSMAYTCGSLITILLVSINGAFAPWLGNKLHENKLEDIRKFSRYYIFSFCIFALGIMLISPEILLIIGGKSYLEARYVMTPVTMGCVCQFLYTMFVNIEQFKKKTVGMAIASVIAAITNFGLNNLFIPRFGYLAAAYTTLAGYFLLLIMHMFLVYRLNFAKAYSYKLVLLSVAVGCICMGIITFLYDYTIARYIVFLIYLIAVIIVFCKYKSLLIGLWKNKG